MWRNSLKITDSAYQTCKVHFPRDKRHSDCGKPRNLLISPKNISWNQLFRNFFSKNVAFTKFVWKKISKISTLWNRLSIYVFYFEYLGQKIIKTRLLELCLGNFTTICNHWPFNCIFFGCKKSRRRPSLTNAQCGNYSDLLFCIFDKNFVKAMHHESLKSE